jgi:opacity protein-like surface antigen
MRFKLILLLAALMLSLPACAQIQPSAERGGARLGIGGGLDYWRGDWSKIARFGPSAWVTAEYWHGLGIIAEGHSMIAGGDSGAQQYKYFSGEGGAVYSYHHWHNVQPYVKGEIGFAGLSFPHKPTSTYTHDTRTTWAIGGGIEYKLWKHVWARGDYTYDNFPNFYSVVTHQHHTLSPAGFTLGATYYFH